MSNALSIAAVTAVLKDLLDNALIDHSVNTAVSGAVTVSAIAPDLIPTANSDPPRLNLYLYQVTPNQGWRNVGLPSHSDNGRRLTNPPLALDLHYMLTAYASADFQAEILLGYAMQRLHEVPVLTREAIRTTLAAVSPVDGSILPPAVGTLAASELAEQVELVKITPESMGGEEISKLWTAFQASYRPSAAYRASVVLIESRQPARTPLPVLTRGPRDLITGRETGIPALPSLTPPYPTLAEVLPPNQQPSAYLGETVRLVGHHLSGTGVTVVFEHPRLSTPLQVAPATSSSTEITAPLQLVPATDPANWPAGIYTVHVALTQNGTDRTTNRLPLALAPRIDSITAGTAGTTTTFTVTTAPEVRPQQTASLVVGNREVFAEDHPAQTNTLTFEMEDVAAGTYYVRLRVDGVESILIDRTTSPPTFLASQQVTV